jgi:hypothetical protein
MVADELLDLLVVCAPPRPATPCRRNAPAPAVPGGAHELEAAHHAVHVVAVGQEVRVDQRRLHRVVAGQLDAAPALAGAAGRRGTSSRGRSMVLRPWSTSLPITKCNCRSGMASSGWLLMKPPASAKLVVSMPVRGACATRRSLDVCTMPCQRHAKQVFSCGASTTCTTSGWSCRCCPRRAGRARWRCRSLQVGCRPDARQHQHLRRLQRAGAQQHLAAGAQLLSPRAGTPRPPRVCLLSRMRVVWAPVITCRLGRPGWASGRPWRR